MKIDIKYQKYKKIYSSLNIHFVFCAKYRRRVFDREGAKECFKKAAAKEIYALGLTPLMIECKEEYVHLYLRCPPDISPSKVLTSIKRATSAALKKEIFKLDEHASIWTWDALVATDVVFVEQDIQTFLETQKGRRKKSESLLDRA